MCDSVLMLQDVKLVKLTMLRTHAKNITIMFERLQAYARIVAVTATLADRSQGSLHGISTWTTTVPDTFGQQTAANWANPQSPGYRSSYNLLQIDPDHHECLCETLYICLPPGAPVKVVAFALTWPCLASPTDFAECPITVDPTPVAAVAPKSTGAAAAPADVTI